MFFFADIFVHIFQMTVVLWPTHPYSLSTANLDTQTYVSYDIEDKESVQSIINAKFVFTFKTLLNTRFSIWIEMPPINLYT
jgi:hypothetical protein